MDNLRLPSDDLPSEELKRWLLRLKYSFLLHQRRVRKFPRHKPNRLVANRHSIHLNIILGLAASAYFWMTNPSTELDELLRQGELPPLDELVAEQKLISGAMKADAIKAVLRARGTSFDSIIERKDLEALAKVSGEISKLELGRAVAEEIVFNRFNASCSFDARLYQEYIPSNNRVADFSQCYPSQDLSLHRSSLLFSPSAAKTTVFDSTSLFVERIEDNRESLWILSVGGGHYRQRTPTCSKFGSSSCEFINGATWAHLVHRFSAFDVRFGILLCDKLESICANHDFSPATLIMALPNSLGSWKQAVEFRRFTFPLSGSVPPVSCDSQSLDGKRACFSQTDQVSSWIEEVLSHRIISLTSSDQLLAQRFSVGLVDRLWTKPSPLHVVWVPGNRPLDRVYSPSDAPRAPLAFSALSITHLGRVKLWRLDAQSEILKQSGCDVKQKTLQQQRFHLSSANFFLINPDGACQRIYVPPIYANLNRFIRWNFPSLNDVFKTALILMNTVIALADVLALVLVFLSEAFDWLFPLKRRKPLQRLIATPQLRTRIGLISNIVKLTFSGWNNYGPACETSATTSTTSSAASKLSFRWWLRSAMGAFVSLGSRLFIANLIFLLAALPIVNIMSHALPVVNVFLWFLRKLVYIAGLAYLYVNVFSFYYIINVVLSILIGGLAFSILPVMLLPKLQTLMLSMRKHRGMSSNSVSTTASTIGAGSVTANSFLAKLLKMSFLSTALNSPASLARHLVLSDTEFDHAASNNLGSATSDDTDLSSGGNQPPPNAGLRTLESVRLYRKVMELENAVTESSRHGLNAVDTEHLLALLQPQNSRTPINSTSGRPMTVGNTTKSPAKLFTWIFTELAATTPNVSQASESKSKKVVSPRNAAAVHGVDEDEPYYAESEGERYFPVRPSRPRKRCRLRPILRCQLTSSSSSCSPSCERREPSVYVTGAVRLRQRRSEWPGWVIPCDYCVVCWHEFKVGEELAALVCGHAFHSCCVKRWLDTGRVICPVCRWPANLSHQQRERQLICQLVKSLKVCLHSTRQTSTASMSSELSVQL